MAEKNKSLSLKNGYWYDKAGNCWSIEMYTHDEALVASSGLLLCSCCINCEKCVNCEYCISCKHCINCKHCVSSVRCTECLDILHCDTCAFCERCEERKSKNFIYNGTNEGDLQND